MASDLDDNVDAAAAAAADLAVGKYVVVDAATSVDCWDNVDSGDDNDDSEGSDGSDNGIVGDEDANVAVVFGTVEDGREPLHLIRAPSPRDLLALLVLSEQVRGPIREVEESEYDWEEDP